MLPLSRALIVLYKNQDYVHLDQFVSCFVIVSVNNAFIFNLYAKYAIDGIYVKVSNH
jgi:hypothetical protein